MKRSTDRIITSHAGSLSRPDDLIEINRRRIEGESYSEADREATLRQAVADVVRMQSEAGVDVVDDGEFGKASRNAVDFGPWQGYAYGRLGGWEQVDPARVASMPVPAAAETRQAFTTRRDWAKFPRFYAEYMSGRPAGALPPGRLLFTGPITYVGQAAAKLDIDNLKAAVAGARVEEAFMCSVAPGSFARGNNYYYKTDEEYLFALAEAMHEEYKAIIDAGFVLQLDDPALPDSWDSVDPEPTVEQYKRYASVCVEALNHGLRGLPEDRIRYHICWGSWQGPHIDRHTTEGRGGPDVQGAGGVLLDRGGERAPRARVEGLGREIKLPEGKSVMPGFVEPQDERGGAP